MIDPKDVAWYFAHEIQGLKEEDLLVTIDGDEVTIRALHWLGDLWDGIMDYVDAMDGRWVKDGKNSRWELSLDWLEDRVKYEKFWALHRPVIEWWISMPRSVKALMQAAYPAIGEAKTTEDKALVLAATPEWKKKLTEMNENGLHELA